MEYLLQMIGLVNTCKQHLIFLLMIKFTTMKYDKDLELSNLRKAIDISIVSIKKFYPKNYSEVEYEKFVRQFESVYLEYKNGLNVSFTKKSIDSVKNDILIYFQESSGPAIEYFWSELKKNNIGYVRENKLGKILKRGKIKN